MVRDPDWYLQERARALAIAWLTRRDDLTVEDGRPEKLNLLVRIKGKGRKALRRFGVQGLRITRYLIYRRHE